MNRREVISAAAALSLSASSHLFGQGFVNMLAVSAATLPTALNGVVLPDDGWNLWIDRQAQWKDDVLMLPDEVDLRRLTINPPTDGWETLDKPLPNLGFAKLVTLPSTVEQHFWGAFGHRSYRSDEYFYAATDPVPQNGAYLGVSWWWRNIDIPLSMRGKRILLKIRGARLRAEVYLNRQLVGYSILEELPFECDLTAAVNFEPDATGRVRNQLAVRITNIGGRYDWQDGGELPWGGVHFYTGHGFGGLDRELVLSAHESVRIADAWVLNTLDLHTVQCSARIENTGSGAQRGQVEFSVVDPVTNSLLARSEASAEVEQDAPSLVQVRISTKSAQPWSRTSPKLYKLIVRWIGSDAKHDEREVLFGFRSFAVDGLGTNAIFRLNGQRIRLYSAISWGYWGLNGLWPTTELARKEVDAAQAYGLNCLNFHRNIGKTEVLREQDARGLLRVMEPGAGRYAIRIPGHDSAGDLFAQRYMIAKCLHMVRTFRSHPSLVQWTLQNELGGVSLEHDNGQDLHDPAVRAILQAIHTEDPSRSIILNDGLVDRGKPQAWFAPWDDTYRTSLEGGAGGWFVSHGGPSGWTDELYKGPEDFAYLSEDRTEIVQFGEMSGNTSLDNHALMVQQIGQRGGTSYDLEDHREILASYEAFLSKWGFREAFPDTDVLFRAIAAKMDMAWEQFLENVRLSEVTDIATISGWESTAIEDHAGLVDNLRNPKGDPSIICGSLAPVRGLAKQRKLVLGKGEKAAFDLYLFNELNKPVYGDFRLTMTDPSGANRELERIPLPAYEPDRFCYLLKQGFQTPPLSTPGLYGFRAELTEAPLATRTRGILVVDVRRRSKMHISIGAAGISSSLRQQLAALDFVTIEEYRPSGWYDLLVTSGMTGQALAEKLVDNLGDPAAFAAATKAEADAMKRPGKMPQAMLSSALSGVPLLVLAPRDELAEGVAKQVADAGLFRYTRQVGGLRAPWMGNWYFVRRHPLFDGLPQDQAMSTLYQIRAETSNGLLIDGPGVEVLVGYSRDHDRFVGAGTFIATSGKCKVLFERVPEMQPVMRQRWLANAVDWLCSQEHSRM